MIGKIVFALALAGILYLFFFNKPRHHSTEELQNWFSTRLESISTSLQKDIELDKQGQYPHQGKQTFERKGSISYHLLDKQLARFDLSEMDDLSKKDIKATDGWQTLKGNVSQLGLRLELDEVEIDGDEVDSYESLDEYIDDIGRYYIVTVSGW